MASRGKSHLGNVRGFVEEESSLNNEKQTNGENSKENRSTKDKEEEDNNQGIMGKKQNGPCRPKMEITPRVVLNNPALQELREHMETYAIIYKFMGLWPTKNDLYTWIKYHWKPKGNIDLHHGSKGFFTVVFTNNKDKDKIFEGGPYFFAAVGLYMQPWVMNFFLEWETFTSVTIWVRHYSLPLDYQQNESLAAIGNKLGHFVKASEATRRGKYTSYARIFVEMDLSGALPNEAILEVFDEEWLQMVDYEHIPFRCHKCHESETALSIKQNTKVNSIQRRIQKDFKKWQVEEKEVKRNQSSNIMRGKRSVRISSKLWQRLNKF